MLLIAEQEENDGSGGYSPVSNTTFPFSQAHTPFYLALHKTSTQVQWPVRSGGSDQRGHSHLHLPSLLCKSLSEISRALSLEQCLVAGLLNNYFFSFSGCMISSDSPRLQFAQCATCEPWVGAPVGASPPPTAVGELLLKIQQGWNPSSALLICAFNTLSCLLTALPAGPCASVFQTGLLTRSCLVISEYF